MRIDIVSDVICPWCFVGLRRLERAMALRPEIDVRQSWRPFLLNPEMPPPMIATRFIEGYCIFSAVADSSQCDAVARRVRTMSAMAFAKVRESFSDSARYRLIP